MLADVRFDWLPPIPPERLALYALAAVAVAVVLRLVVGGPSRAARSPVLFALRTLMLLALAAVLLNPVRVETTPGETDRPEVPFLFDASESMALGEPYTRWSEVGRMLTEAAPELRGAHARIVPYSFGRRLRAVETDDETPTDAAGTAAEVLVPFASLQPTETDTRLAVALRQLAGRIGRKPPAGIVLFSDGRTRDPELAEAAAGTFAELKVPVHVVPVGGGSGGGDVAIVGVAAPERVRKYSENRITVFLRSFGYDGQRAEVMLTAAADDRGPEQPLGSLPVTLAGGVQSVTLPFRSDVRSRTLRIAIPPRADEVSAANNRFETDVEIDRTKIRVLYVEGSDDPLRYIATDSGFEAAGPHTPLQDALLADPDIECVSLVTGGLGALRLIDRNSQGTLSTRGFPDTTAELFAFDAIILSDVSRDLLTDEQLKRLERWIGRRGGGLCVVGGRNAFDGRWAGTPLSDMLPVTLAEATGGNPFSALFGFRSEPGGAAFDASPVTLRPAAAAVTHPLWRIASDDVQNRRLIDAMPPIPGSNGPLVPKPDVAETIGVATASSESTQGAESREGPPMVVAGKYGRGRTLAVSPPIAAPPGADPLIDAWGETQGAYYGKLWRNAVYWLTENSSTGRRRLLAETDKRFYRPEETVAIRSTAFDEAADPTEAYRIVAMIEPKSLDIDLESLDSPLLWPEGMPRTSGEDGPFVTWGEELELRPDADGRFGLDLKVAPPEDEAADLPAVRVELTAYEGHTQVDSTSVDVQILDDPFERRAPFPDHGLLERIAKKSGGRTFASAADLTGWLASLPVEIGEPTVRREPMWDRWPILLAFLGLLTADWLWRRKAGLA